jgi:hypothetical protein
MRTTIVAACLIAVLAAATGAVDLALDATDIAAAISLGQSRIDRDRIRFHQPYRTIAGKAPLDYIDVVTPFRRVVLAAEASVLAGDRTFGQRKALDLAAAADHELDIIAEFTFHPLNNHVGVPGYLIRLEGRRPPIARIDPRRFERVPRYGVRVEGAPPGAPANGITPGKSQPLFGGALVAHFDGQLLDPAGEYDVVIEEAGKELARVRVELAKLR